jgi:hypothetical protein
MKNTPASNTDTEDDTHTTHVQQPEQPSTSIQITQYAPTITSTNSTTSTVNNLQSTYKVAHTTTNQSAKMRQISQKQFTNNIQFSTQMPISRIEMADHWEQFNVNSNDVLILTKNGFILKSDTDINILTNNLKELQNKNIINSVSIKSPTLIQTNIDKDKQENSFSAIIASVEKEILVRSK